MYNLIDIYVDVILDGVWFKGFPSGAIYNNVYQYPSTVWARQYQRDVLEVTGCIDSQVSEVVK